MSLVISVALSDGIVLASDSRFSYINPRGVSKVATENIFKLFPINKRIAVGISGIHVLLEDGILKSIPYIIDRFRKENACDEMDVVEVAEKLHFLFLDKQNWHAHLDQLVKEIEQNMARQGLQILEMKKDIYRLMFKYKDHDGTIKDGTAGINGLNLIVSGYNRDLSHQVYISSIPGMIQKTRDSREKGKEYGATWIGQGEMLSRLIKGYDLRIKNLRFVGDAIQKSSEDNILQQLNQLEYVFQWATLSIQDAVDFCNTTLQTLSLMHRFTDGIVAEPGDTNGIGGPIDIAVITRDKGFIWLKKKRIRIDQREIDIF